ncbi:MAG: hypothetical protein ACYDAC_03065 [Candidatus Dormibacteria bacterium]
MSSDGRRTHELDPTALSIAATTSEGGLGTAGPELTDQEARPWSPSAAMEPVPPVAPPPARPGSGAEVNPSGPAARRGPAPATVASLSLLVLAALVIVVLVLTLGH